MTLTALLLPALDPDDADAFDHFARGGPYPAYQQSRAWADAARGSRVRDYLYFLCRDGETPVGAAVVRRTGLGWAWVGTVQRGPLVHDVARFAAVVVALRAAVARAGCCALNLAPRAYGRAMPGVLEALRSQGFMPLPDPRQSLHVATGMVALDRPETAILAGFKQRGRRQIKLATQAGVTIRAVTGADDLRTYQRVTDAFAADRPDYDMSGQPDAAGQSRLIAEAGGAMLLAELDGAAIGGHAFVRQGDEAIWLSLVNLPDRPDVPRAYPLLWEAMRAARAQGCIAYDLAGLPLAGPRDAGEANRVQFKTAFAPEHRILPAMHGLPIAPVRHWLVSGARGLYRGSGLRRLATHRARTGDVRA